VEAHPLGCVSVLHLVQACVRAGLRPRLYLITRGAQPVRPGEVPDVHQAPVWGLGRSIRSEHPELRCTLIDLDDQVDELAEELVGNDVEDELALRGADRFVHRLVRVTPEEVRNPGRRDEGEPAAYRFESEKPGLIETVRPRAMTRREPGAGEVEIEIRAAALNFKDVAKALDLLGEESLRDTWSGRRLGLECAGVVVRRGEGVTGLEVGDAVIAQAAGCLASHVTVDARFTVPLPAHLSFEEAVTLPVAFGTAAHALEELARLERGERILIHAACGGVGLAAIQLARRAGAEVFATAGSAEKRAFLGLLGVRHVMDSRKLDFQHEVLERTGGRGVDVVLNSLTGASLMSSLAVLAPGGRFLELGKRDIEQNARLPLQAFQNNLSFFAIDLDRLWSARPEAIRDSLARTMQRLKEGTIHPLPYRAFPFAEAQDAFRWLARARHIGKVVLTRPRSLPDERVIGPDRGGLFRPDATYLITGGLGGFGLATARWLVENGARCVVLVGRSGLVTDEGREAVDEMERTGARIRIARADVTQEEQVRGVLQHVRETLPPLRGIFHAAMVQNEGLLGQLDRERFDSVLAPKIAGALNLHRLSLPDALDHFVLFSSIASLFGGVGLSSYAAANAGLDALAHHRRARGLPGLAVNWTAVEDVGFVAGRPEIRAAFARRGFVPLDSGVLLEALGILLRQGAVQTAVMQLDWSQVQTRALPALSPTYSALRAPHEGEPSLPQERARGEGLRGKLAELVARVLMLAPERIESDQPLTALGLESMMAVDLSHRVRAELGLEIAILKLLGGATLNQLLDDLQEQLDITHTTRWQPVSE
jgi:NADPH:quinone reductase-like Zn-dependent oxidoreductase/acyl carrier protein